MRRSLISRLERLEARRLELCGPRIHVFRPLPRDYIGERHIVAVKTVPAGSDDGVREYEERPGPAPPDSDKYLGVLFMTPDDLKL